MVKVEEEKRQEQMKAMLSKSVLITTCQQMRVHGGQAAWVPRWERHPSLILSYTLLSPLAPLSTFIPKTDRRNALNGADLPKGAHLHRRREQHDHRRQAAPSSPRHRHSCVSGEYRVMEVGRSVGLLLRPAATRAVTYKEYDSL